MQTILLKFSGPLQSWGTSSHFENRRTDRFPSRSAVIGMIAASLGYRRYEDKKLRKLDHLSFAVRIDQPGDILRDYQIATVYKPNGEKSKNYVTNRYYLQDAVFVVAIGSDNEELIEEIYTSLRNPYFPLYLGRRSLPVNYDYILESPIDNDVINALKDEEWQASDWYRNKHSNRISIWADSNLLKNNYHSMVKDFPESFSQGRVDSDFNSSDRRAYRLRPVSHIIFEVKNNSQNE